MRTTLFLALAAMAQMISAPAAADFLVLRCNTQVNGSTFATSLRISFPGGRVEHVSGQDGLTESIAFDARRAVAWTRQTYPDRTAGHRGYYDGNCGVRSEDNDND